MVVRMQIMMCFHCMKTCIGYQDVRNIVINFVMFYLVDYICHIRSVCVTLTGNVLHFLLGISS